MISIRSMSGVAITAAALALAPSFAEAQNWPTRPVLTISPFSAGNANDLVARVVLDQVGKSLGQSFVIDNRPGGGGVIGASAAARAAPDGYTLFLLSSTLASHVVLHESLAYDPVKDFKPVVLFGIQPSVLVAAPVKGWKTVSDLVAAAKAKPGTLNFASAGVGSASHIAAERLRLAAKLDVQHIPFRGPIEAFSEVIAGRIDYYYLPIAPALPNIRSGKVVALAVSTPERAKLLPDVPTVKEAGFPTAEYLFWGGLAFPAKTPPEIAQKLHAEAAKALKHPDVQGRLAKLGVVARPLNVAEFEKFYQDYVKETVDLAKEIGLKPKS